MILNDAAELIALLVRLEQDRVKYHLVRMISVPAQPKEGDVPDWDLWRAFDKDEKPVLDSAEREYDSTQFRRVQYPTGSHVTANGARKMLSDISRFVA